ncbi:MAG: two-component system, chemotaxis family, protein-glutamate methylesterase/glutaminase [Actinomycetota bacterium]|nr:two-component system, chemotaxis family, protein-glutamate methylesterase/glutaminase [Actinomycetota bacterium]
MAGSGEQAPIKVLVVDDSAVARQMISRAVRAAGDMEVTGAASNGRIALEHIALAEPDVVVLDLEMPELDGLGFLRAVRLTHPHLPVIVFSALTATGAAATLAAIAAGASAFALKPSALRGSSDGTVDTELIPQIRALAGRRATPPPATPRVHKGLGRRAVVVNAVVIAVSTGGPNALDTLLGALPSSLPVPILIVQHMPATFTRLLAQRLAANCSLAVVEAQQGQLVRAGVAYIAPGGTHMAVARGTLDTHVVLSDDPPENSCRPAADVLFRSAAAVFGSGVLGVVMTGMGRDGLAGSRAVVAAGGSVVVQEPASAVVPSMPEAVVHEGLADAALTLLELAAEITRRCGVRAL